MAKKQTVAAMPEQPQELRISLPPDSKLKGEIKGGLVGTVKIVATGKVTGYSMEKWGCSLTVRLETLDVDSGMGGDIKKLKAELSGKAEEKEEKEEEY